MKKYILTLLTAGVFTASATARAITYKPPYEGSKIWRTIIGKTMTNRLLTIILLLLMGTIYAGKGAPNAQIGSTDSLEIYFCGTGTPSSNKAIRHPSCLAVAYDNDVSLFDAGESASIQIGKLGIQPYMVSRIFLTHLHSDHISGIGDLMIQSWISGRNKHLPVYGPYGLNQVVKGINMTFGPDIWFRSINREGILNPNIVAITEHTIDLGNDSHKQVWSNKALTVDAVPVHHEPVSPAFGYQLTYNNCRVFITGDTRVFDNEPDLFKGNDVVISEATSRAINKGLLEKAKNSNNPNNYKMDIQTTLYHSDSIELAKAAQKAKIENLYLTHLDPNIGESEKEKQAFTAGMDEYFKGTIVVADDLDKIILKSNKNGSCDVTYVPHP